MELITNLIDFVLHLDTHLNVVIEITGFGVTWFFLSLFLLRPAWL